MEGSDEERFDSCNLNLGHAVVSGHALVIDKGLSRFISRHTTAVGRLNVQYADVEIFYSGGRLYVEGKIDENGMFSFDPK